MRSTKQDKGERIPPFRTPLLTEQLLDMIFFQRTYISFFEKDTKLLKFYFYTQI